MNSAAVIGALRLPSEASVDQRVPKKLLLENGARTAGDKRQINDGIEELLWVATLKPGNIGVPAFRDANHEYIEIAVLCVSLRATAKAPRIIELIHRAIPYPLMLIAALGETISVSLAHKRLSQIETGSIVLEGEILSVELCEAGHLRAAPATLAGFFASLPVAAQPSRNLFALYQGWIDRLSALEAANITGSFVLHDSPEKTIERRFSLEAHCRLQGEIANLRAQADRETQINKRVEINHELQRLEAELVVAKARM